MNSITTSNPNLPTAISKILGEKLTVLSNRCLRLPDRTEIDIELLPETREALEARAKLLDGWLQPCGPEFALRQVTPLFSVLGYQNRDEDDREMAIKVYSVSLGRLPAFALKTACQRFIEGHVPNQHWLPAPGEIQTIAEGLAGNFHKQKRDITSVLSAELVKPDPEQRKAIAEKYTTKLKGMAEAGRQAERQRCERQFREEEARTEAERLKRESAAKRLDALVHNGLPDDRPMPMLSEGARRKYGPVQNVDAAE